MYSLFLQELNIVKSDFELHRKTPEILRSHPDYAGSAFWARSLHRRVSHSYNLLTNAYYLPKTSLHDSAKEQFEALTSSLEEYIIRTHADWVSSIPINLEEKLECSLMSHRGDLLEIKFDKDLIRLFAEIGLYQKLKSDIPFRVQEVYSKKEELRLLVVRDYNKIIKALSKEEHLLFKERIRFLDKKIKPGLTNLTWSSKGISDYFVKECRRHAQDIQKNVSDFMESKSKISKICATISQTLLWHVESKKIYELSEFESTQESYRNSIKSKFVQAHQDIKQVLEQSFEAFKNDGKEVYQHWLKYIEKVDGMVEESLRITFKKSLLEISKAINGEGKNREGGVEVHPLFKVNVVLEMQKVDFNPTLVRLEETVNKVAREMTSIIAVVPRLIETLGADSSKKYPKMFDIIANEEDVLKIFVNIQTGMSNNATKCQHYLRTWDSYREIWEINKDAFIRRYAKLKPALSTFDADINRYSEVANNTQKEETLTNINFVRLDCSPLKHALVAHCSAWQNKLTTLLNSNSSAELNNLYDMFERKTEKLKTPPQNIDQLSESLTILAQLQAEVSSIEAQFQPIHDQYAILEKYEVAIKPEEKSRLEKLSLVWAEFQQTLSDSEKYLQEIKSKFKNDLLVSVDEFARSAANLRDDFNNKGPFSSIYGSDKAVKTISDYRAAISNLANQERNISKGLAVFKLEYNQSKEIENLAADLDILSQVWAIYQEWTGVYEEWRKQPFLKLDSAVIEEVVQKILKRLTKLSKDVKNWDVFYVI